MKKNRWVNRHMSVAWHSSQRHGENNFAGVPLLSVCLLSVPLLRSVVSTLACVTCWHGHARDRQHMPCLPAACHHWHVHCHLPCYSMPCLTTSQCHASPSSSVCRHYSVLLLFLFSFCLLWLKTPHLLLYFSVAYSHCTRLLPAHAICLGMNTHPSLKPPLLPFATYSQQQDTFLCENKAHSEQT